MKKLIASTFISCLPLFCAIVCMYGIVYIALQQYIRLSADEVPIRYAADIKARLESGVPLRQAIRGIDSTDMQISLAPFAMICDHKGRFENSYNKLAWSQHCATGGRIYSGWPKWRKQTLMAT